MICSNKFLFEYLRVYNGTYIYIYILANLINVSTSLGFALIEPFSGQCSLRAVSDECLYNEFRLTSMSKGPAPRGCHTIISLLL